MEQPQIYVQPTAAAGLSDSAARLGTTLAERQIEATQAAYQQRYTQGVSNFWQKQIDVSSGVGHELAALKLEAQRQFAIAVARWVFLLGVPCGLIGWWAWGPVVGVIFVFGSVISGIYVGSR